MRSAFILALMAATAVTPVASAAAQDRGRDRSPRAERESRPERPQRAERVQRSERAEPRQRPARIERAERAPRQIRERAAYAAPNRTYQPSRTYQQRSGTFDRRADRRERRDVRTESRYDRRDAYIQRSRDAASPVTRNRSGSGSWSDNRRSGSWADNRHRSGSWSRDWRNDRRYDWQRYRSSNRHLYHLGRYYSPYRNHRYSRFSIGLFLGSAFYGSNYWLSDPWYYRLPPAYPGTRWVRYYDDVMLVDTYTGEVLDVIYDFFW